ncbi:MAG: flagellar basal body rod protein FlgB [Alphaproteobacteria bacterium]
MTTQNIGLLNAIGAKMDYLNQRQTIIAQNVANSDTPNYRPKDLKEYDFASLVNTGNDGVKDVKVAITDAQHLPDANGTFDPKSQKQRDMYEVAPAGNSVIIEEQLINAGRNTMDYNLMLNIYQKQIGMFKTALGVR